MKPARVLGPSLLLALCSVYALRASAQNFSGDAYRYGAMARAEEGLGENTEALAHFNQSLARSELARLTKAP